ncbi:hypothetical protein [Delftia acidovorans]
MDASEIYNGIATAVEAAKPAQEYCLKYLDQTWGTCMTKAEWSGWAQAVFSVAAIFSGFIALFVASALQRKVEKEKERRKALYYLRLHYPQMNATAYACTDMLDSLRHMDEYPSFMTQLKGIKKYLNGKEIPKSDLLILLGLIIKDGDGCVVFSGEKFVDSYLIFVNAMNSIIDEHDVLDRNNLEGSENKLRFEGVKSMVTKMAVSASHKFAENLKVLDPHLDREISKD